MKATFEEQTKLLLEVLSIVMQTPSFALKGGTAINFFHSDMPRLSIDIDLAYLKITPREVFLAENEEFHKTLSTSLQQKKGLRTQIKRTKEGIACHGPAILIHPFARY